MLKGVILFTSWAPKNNERLYALGIRVSLLLIVSNQVTDKENTV